jgi:hypothetical protein
MTPRTRKRARRQSNAENLANTRRARRGSYAHQIHPHQEEATAAQPDPSDHGPEDEPGLIVQMLNMGIDSVDPDYERALTPVTPLSELPEDDMPMASIRWAEKEYKLEPDEDLSGPTEEHGKTFALGAPVKSVTHSANHAETKRSNPRLNKTERKIRQSVNIMIIASWPNSDLDQKKAQSRMYGLVDASTFWHKVLRPVFALTVTKWLNENDEMVRQP